MKKYELERRNRMSYLHRAEKLEAYDAGNLVKFSRVADTIVARFLYRDMAKTKMGISKRLSVEILESNIEGVEPGPGAIFESNHISQIMEKNKLKAGQGFMLKLCGIDKMSRFKRFGYQRVPEIDNCPQSDGGDGSPDWLLDTADPDEEREPGSDD
jgi:hypothetical protein